MNGVAGIYRFSFGSPGVGHFRSVEGRQAYARYYAETPATLPPPATTYDIPTISLARNPCLWSPPDILVVL